jgi:predicted LPLAT superfamily acyltransferase
MSNHWSQIQESGGLLGMRLMFFLYRWFGRWLFNIVLYPVILYFFISNRTAREASMDYIDRLEKFGTIPQQKSLRSQSFRHFLQFGKTLLDKLAAWTGAFNYDNVRFQHREEFLSMIDKGKGALIIVSHLGNLEVCRALANESQRLKLNILVHTKHAEKFNRLMNDIDTNNRLNLIQVTDFSPATAIVLQEKLNLGEAIVIAGDRTPVDGGRELYVDFLNAKAAFPQGPYILASLLKCPTYLMFCAKDSQGYKIFFEHFADTIKLNRKNREGDMRIYAQKFAQRLEIYVQKFPFQWNNFFMFWKKPNVPKDIKS